MPRKTTTTAVQLTDIPTADLAEELRKRGLHVLRDPRDAFYTIDQLARLLGQGTAPAAVSTARGFVARHRIGIFRGYPRGALDSLLGRTGPTID